MHAVARRRPALIRQNDLHFRHLPFFFAPIAEKTHLFENILENDSRMYIIKQVGLAMPAHIIRKGGHT